MTVCIIDKINCRYVILFIYDCLRLVTITHFRTIHRLVASRIHFGELATATPTTLYTALPWTAHHLNEYARFALAILV